MKKLNKKIKVGTMVKVSNLDFSEIESIEENRLLFKLKDYAGSWQAGHILAFTNNTNYCPNCNDINCVGCRNCTGFNCPEC